MGHVRERFPSVELLEQATVYAVGHSVIKALIGAPSLCHPTNFLLNVAPEFNRDSPDAQGRVERCLSEAWAWLKSEGLLCEKMEHSAWVFVSRRGSEAAKATDFDAWSADQDLRQEQLAPALRALALQLFREGRLETAVFEAFKELEVSIRDAAALGADLIGTSLASRAFNPEDGPLTDMSAERGERVALMNLMTGALGSYKNPHSHRRVEISATEAREMITLASHLLRIVEARRAVLRAHAP
jgi:uncharacterized protein (TIGR02391 family)